MNKTIMFLGMLAVSFANAQQTNNYDGKVAINHTEPKATLEVQPTAANLAKDTNEGIIAPKLTKERIASIAVPVEGTLVYATNAEYTGTDVKVAKIDEKGYYYFDGAEWVKAKNVAQDQEWVYDATTNRINLRRSGQAQGFVNKVYYNAENGNFFNGDDTKGLERFNTETGQIENYDYDFIPRSSFISKTSKLQGRFNERKDRRDKYSEENVLILDGADESLPNVNENRIGKGSFIDIYSDHTHNISQVTGMYGVLNSWAASGEKSILIGTSGTSAVRTGNITSKVYSTGIRGASYWNSTGQANMLTGAWLASNLGQEAGNVNKLYGAYLQVYANGTGKIKEKAIIDGNSWIQPTFKGSIDNLYGFRYSHAQGSTSRPSNHYGLYLGSITAGSVNNYAIYSENGNVRFGDLRGNNSRLVIANNNGVLSTDTNGEFASKWIAGDNRTIKLKNMSDNTTTRTDINNFFIKDNGNIGIASANPNAKLDVAGRLLVDSFNPAISGISLRAFKTEWNRGYNFMSEDYQNSLGGFQAYSTKGDTIQYFSIGSNHLDKTIVKLYPDTYNVHFRGNIGVGVNTPKQKLDVAGAIKIANSTDDTCDTTKAGTIRFVNDKFQGCRSTGWVDLHN